MEAFSTIFSYYQLAKLVKNDYFREENFSQFIMKMTHLPL